MSALTVWTHNRTDATSGVVTRTLPPGQAAGTELSVEKVDTSTNAVSITGNIRGVGSSTILLSLKNESITFRADSAGSWWPIADHKTLSSLAGYLIPQNSYTPAADARTVLVDSPSWSSARPFGVVNKDGLFFVKNFADASGIATVGGVQQSFTKLFGGNASKSGQGNLDAFWASVNHLGPDEVGLFIGDVTGSASGQGGNLWGGHFRLTDNYAATGSYMRGLILELIPNVLNTKSSIGLQVTNNGDVLATGNTNSTTALTLTAGSLQNGQLIIGAGIPNGTIVASGGGTNNIVMSAAATATATGVALTGQWQLSQGVRVNGAFGKSLIIYSDAAGTIDAFDVDQFGNVRVGGTVTPLVSSGSQDLGAIGLRWRNVFANNFLLNGADSAGSSGALSLANAVAAPSRANTNGGTFFVSSGRPMWQGTGGSGTTPSTLSAGTGVPTLVAQTGAGTSATATLATGGNDDAGTVTITPGGTGIAAGAMYKVTFNALLAATPRTVTLTPGNAAAVSAGICFSGAGTSGFMITTVNAPTTGAALVVGYKVHP